MIQHFILTRSCYRQTDLKYLRYRFKLMKQLCGASLAGQTRQDFTWIVRTNPDSPLTEETAAYFHSLSFPVACLCSPLPSRDTSDAIFTRDADWKAVIQSRLLPETTHVLTTRLDDDDALAPNFVERLRRKVKESASPVAWNFPVGYVLTLSTTKGSFARLWRFEKNQFASLISPAEPLVIVNDAKHGNIDTLGPIRLVDDRPAFVWTRHPHTKSAGGRSRAEIPVRDLMKTFPVLVGVY